MFKNYVVTAWRNMRKHKVFSYINLGGLTIGITAVLLIGIYIQSELSYDHFQGNLNTLYRVGFRTWQQGVLTGESPEFTAPFGVEAKKDFPEIRSFCRISENHEGWLSYAGKQLKTSGISYADSSFFQLFSFPLLSGTPAGALTNPRSIVLTQNLARKFFGGRDAVGKSLVLDGKTNYLVTGVVQNPPLNSTLQFDALLSFSTLYQDANNHMDWNGGWQYQHYLLLQNNASPASLQGKFDDFMKRNFNEKYAGTARVDASLQPFSKIHLYYNYDSANTRTNLYVFGIIALLILTVSGINYVNLSIAQASGRFKEIGVRKVLGAERMQLTRQFMGETCLVTLCALLLAVLLTILLTPSLRELVRQTIDDDLF